MKILGLSGSLRSDSHNTRLLLGAGGLLPRGTEFEVFEQLSSIPPYNEDDEHTTPPAVDALKRAIAGADAVLVATPEYNASIPGVLKNALDWVSRPVADSPLKGKPAAVIGARVVDRELPVGQADEALGANGLPLERELVQELSATLDEMLELAQPHRVAA